MSELESVGRVARRVADVRTSALFHSNLSYLTMIFMKNPICMGLRSQRIMGYHRGMSY